MYIEKKNYNRHDDGIAHIHGVLLEGFYNKWSLLEKSHEDISLIKPTWWRCSYKSMGDRICHSLIHARVNMAKEFTAIPLNSNSAEQVAPFFLELEYLAPICFTLQ